MIIRLATFLITQGLQQSSITILVPYQGQYDELRTALKRQYELQNVKLVTLDRYQGEENDVILLSLVRTGDSIGFLKKQNRMCVALSRARLGMYIVGKESPALRASPWRTVLDDLARTGCIGRALPVTCSQHPHLQWLCIAPESLSGRMCDHRCTHKYEKCGHECGEPCHIVRHTRYSTYR